MFPGGNNHWEVLYPAGGPGIAGLARSGALKGGLLPALIPASWMYHALSSAARNVRSTDPLPLPAGTTVVSVGNLEVGGGGKTPLSVHLLDNLARDGGRPVYLSRGYGSDAGSSGVVILVPARGLVPAGDGAGFLVAGVGRIRRDSPGLAARIGDEGAMVTRRLPQIPAVFAANKTRGMEAALAAFRPTHIVLDDAFQSWGIPRHVDIVMLDRKRPFANGWLLPAGTLREPPEAIERADLVGINGARDESDLERAADHIRRHTDQVPPLFGVRRLIRLEMASGEPVTGECTTCAVVSAIARPDRFEAGVDAGSGRVRLALRYPDHHAYTRADLGTILGEADRRGLQTVVTTQKDWAKLSDLAPPRDRFIIARLHIELFGEDPLEAIKEAAE
jgi:tetraacyldisaccharide 4'-kinase